MKLSQVLYSQGFGPRRECEGLIVSGFVTIAGTVCHDPFEDFDQEGLQFTVRGEPWPFREKALIVLNKPAGHECSQKPKHHPSVYSLLPPPLRRRDVQAVGRLDEDTTGLLLMTDDGALIHRWTSPKHHVPKVYEIGCKHPVTAEQVQQLLSGVTLIDDPVPVRAAAAEATGAFEGPQAPELGELHGLRMTLTEGKYHQVKRMVAAVGNRVEALHRSRYGALVLPADLAPGQWRWLAGPKAITPVPAEATAARTPSAPSQ
ncbi:MAG: pseudouridine synthase [Pseudomonadota bacterium]|nr:pseudouridine synthase [Pseudomonadota bacterium]